MLSFIKPHAERFEYYDTVTGMSKIIRRYFVMNSFDGALTMFGLLLGSYIAEVTEPALIISIGIGTAIAMGFSGLTGALFTERAERVRELKKMERALQRKLDDTDYKKAYDFATLVTAGVNASSPLFTALILLSPFVFSAMPDAYYMSFGLSLSLFFLLGIYIGHIAKERLVLTGLKFLGAGVLCLALILLLGQI
ncbi:MAG: hypothetical protein AB1295_01285 [Candidatus Micrarchaeota archaeon]